MRTFLSSSLKFLLKLFVKHFAVRRGEVDLINWAEKNAISTFANDDENRATTLLEMRISWMIMLCMRSENAKTSINLL